MAEPEVIDFNTARKKKGGKSGKKRSAKQG
jgi:hypothetical protein